MSDIFADPPFITAAVVNWNGEAMLPRCLASLRGQRGVRLEILLIDNASRDGSVERVRRDFPEVVVVENADNLGYAAALQQAYERMKGDWLLALNTDVRLEPDCLLRLAECIERARDERCGYAQGKVRFMSADGEPTDRLYSTGHLILRSRLAYNRGFGQTDRGQFDREERIPGANAACLLMRRKMLDDLNSDVGAFDDLFFLYGNDVDFDWLAARRGWSCRYCPDAVCWHVGEASSGVTQRRFDAPYINARFLLMLKHDRPLDALRDLPFVVKENVKDIAPKVMRRPSLAIDLPLDLLRSAPRALRSRRAAAGLESDEAFDAREWLAWSTRLMRESLKE